MPVIWLLLALMFSVSAWNEIVNSDERTVIEQGEVLAISESMLVYRSYVASFAQANPSFSGQVSNAQASIPNWYTRPASLSNYVTSGRSYIFYSGQLSGLAGALAKKLESTTVGKNVGGVLHSPNTGNTGIALPAQVPVSSTVIVQ